MSRAAPHTPADRFVGRRRELQDLDAVLDAPGAQFVLVYGRRRVGKTTLLLHWAEHAGLPCVYWVATRDTPAQVRLGFSRALWRWAHPGSAAVPRFDTWADLFEATARLIGQRRLRSRLARHYYRIARAHLSRCDAAAALDAISRAVTLRPFNPRYRLLRLRQPSWSAGSERR